MIVATLREDNNTYNVYAVDPYRDRFLVDYNGKFKWFAISDFIPFNMFCDFEEEKKNEETLGVQKHGSETI